MKIKMTWEEGFDLWSKLVNYGTISDSSELSKIVLTLEKKIFNF